MVLLVWSTVSLQSHAHARKPRKNFHTILPIRKSTDSIGVCVRVCVCADLSFCRDKFQSAPNRCVTVAKKNSSTDQANSFCIYKSLYECAFVFDSIKYKYRTVRVDKIKTATKTNEWTNEKKNCFAFQIENWHQKTHTNTSDFEWKWQRKK